jgi:hypothetical protein
MWRQPDIITQRGQVETRRLSVPNPVQDHLVRLLEREILPKESVRHITWFNVHSIVSAMSTFGRADVTIFDLPNDGSAEAFDSISVGYGPARDVTN